MANWACLRHHAIFCALGSEGSNTTCCVADTLEMSSEHRPNGGSRHANALKRRESTNPVELSRPPSIEQVSWSMGRVPGSDRTRVNSSHVGQSAMLAYPVCMLVSCTCCTAVPARVTCTAVYKPYLDDHDGLLSTFFLAVQLYQRDAVSCLLLTSHVGLLNGLLNKATGRHSQGEANDTHHA